MLTLADEPGHRLWMKQFNDTYDFDDFGEEPTVPSIRVPISVRVRARWTASVLTSICGAVAAVFFTVGGIFGVVEVIGIGGIIMVFGYTQAAVRGLI